MEFEWPWEELRLRQEVRDFLARELPEHWSRMIPGQEATSDFTREFCGKLAEAGLFVPHWPIRYGGAGASQWQFVVLGEELWQAGEPRGSQYMNVNWIGPAIIANGSKEQKLEHLPRIAAGQAFWCQGFSEAGAGTDLAALQASAERRGDEYVINGVKLWTSYARGAEWCFLLARTDPHSLGRRGISIFLLPTDTPGFTIEPIPSVLDVHEFNRMTLEDVVAPSSARLGPEHQGWDIIKHALAHERIGGPRYARAERMAGVLGERLEAEGDERRIARFGLQLDRARGACRAARLLTYRVFNDRAKGRDQDDVAVSVARVAIVRAERAVAELALSVGGPSSIERGSIGNSQLKTSMIAGLGGGSVEVQLNLIARGLFDPEREG